MTSLPFSADLDWYLNCSDAACGIRSSLGGQIAVLEGATGITGFVESNHYTDAQIEAFGKSRRIWRVWQRLSSSTRDILQRYYEPKRHYPHGVKAYLGEVAAVALYLTNGSELEALLEACDNKTDSVIKEHKELASAAVAEAHLVYFKACGKT
jgi:hypothetical protein